jgi:hypothetical protein
MKYSSIAIISVICGVAAITGCEQTPAEKMAILHSEQQSQINSINYERSVQLRETQENANENENAKESTKENTDDDSDE